MRRRQETAFAPGDPRKEGKPDHHYSLMQPFSAGSALLYPELRKTKSFPQKEMG